jgi:hypothetical protein
VVTQFCEKVKDVDWLCRSRAYICAGKMEVKTTRVFGDDSANINEERANLLINEGFIGSGRGNGRMVRRVEVKMLNSAWIYQDDAGEVKSYKDLVQVLGDAPPSVLDTEFVRALIENFYDDQKYWLILLGFFPYCGYLLSTVMFLELEAWNRTNPNSPEVTGFDPNGLALLAVVL